MGKEAFETPTSKNISKIRKEIAGEIKSANLGNFAIEAVVETDVEKTKAQVKGIILKAVQEIEKLEEACEKARKIKPDVVTVTEDDVRSAVYSEKVWKEKNSPFQKLDKVNKALDKAITSGLPEDFEELEKSLK